ncbi:MAG: hypothetical protein LBL04_12115 [Bacteroidales bacterium]|jgi:hypothetical protein|nr:hypothetical protein [Bacteroidales bacterium]
MSKQLHIVLNLAILLLVAGFVGYVIVSVNSGTVEYSGAETESADFVSPCTLEATGALPGGVRRMRLSGDRIYLASSDSVFAFGRDDMVCLNRFYAGENMADIAVDNGKEEIYALYGAEVRVFTRNGKLIREWEACSDNALYASIALSDDYAFVTDAENKNICQYTKDGNFIRFIHSPRGFVIPSYSFDIENFRDTVYCVNSGRHLVESYTVDGKFIGSFGIPGSKPGTFSGCCNPARITFDADGQMLTSEKGNPRVCLFERSGRFVRMLLNSKMLGGGHDACEIQAENGRIYVAGQEKINVYKTNEISL